MSRPPTPTILVVDDDPAIPTLMRQVLRGEGYHVVVASAPEAAGTILATLRCALVLTDTLNATDRADPDCWDGLAAIRDAARGTPVTIFSAHHLDVFEGYAARGFAGVISKPFDLDGLLATIQATLRPAPRTLQAE